MAIAGAIKLPLAYAALVRVLVAKHYLIALVVAAMHYVCAIVVYARQDFYFTNCESAHAAVLLWLNISY